MSNANPYAPFAFGQKVKWLFDDGDHSEWLHGKISGVSSEMTDHLLISRGSGFVPGLVLKTRLIVDEDNIEVPEGGVEDEIPSTKLGIEYPQSGGVDVCVGDRVDYRDPCAMFRVTKRGTVVELLVTRAENGGNPPLIGIRWDNTPDSISCERLNDDIHFKSRADVPHRATTIVPQPESFEAHSSAGAEIIVGDLLEEVGDFHGPRVGIVRAIIGADYVRLEDTGGYFEAVSSVYTIVSRRDGKSVVEYEKQIADIKAQVSAHTPTDPYVEFAKNLALQPPTEPRTISASPALAAPYGEQPRSKLGANPKDAVGAAKAGLSYLPAGAMYLANLAMMEGAIKYGQFNWRESAVDNRIYIDACKRHMDKYWNGETFELGTPDLPEDHPDFLPATNLHHLAYVIAGCAIILDAEQNGMLIDTRPTPMKQGIIDEIAKLVPGIVARAKLEYERRQAKATKKD